MKRNFFFSVIMLSMAMFAFMPPLKNLVGHWTVTYKSGEKMMIEFKKDGSFVAVLPSEKFTVGGKYQLNGDVLSFADSTCGTNYWGKYKETFLGNDSVYSVVIEDSCGPRRSSVDKVAMVRDIMK